MICEQQVRHDCEEEWHTVFCERLIILYEHASDRIWWQALRDSAAPLFAPSGRLTEAPLAGCRVAVERAVTDGYRPILLVPQPAAWPRVCDALGIYRDFGQILIRGRDDGLITRILHHPAPEIHSAYALRNARLLVPSPEYGKALDHQLPASLDDFVPIAPRSAEPAFACRLNPFRRLSLLLDSAYQRLSLRQRYLTDITNGTCEPYDLPIAIAGSKIPFADGQWDPTPGQVDDIATAVVLRLDPIPQERRHWLGLLAGRLRTMAADHRVSLSRAWQAALEAIAASPIALDQLLSIVVSPTSSHRPRFAGVFPRADPAAILVLHTVTTGAGILFTLYWYPTMVPDTPPTVSISLGGDTRTLSDTEVIWAPDLSQLTLPGLRPDYAEMGWHWEPRSNRLHLVFQLASQCVGQ